MKKSIFILAALFAATFVNAQINLEYTYEPEGGYISSGNYFAPCHLINSGAREYSNSYTITGAETLPCPFYFYLNRNPASITFFNPHDFSIYKTVNLGEFLYNSSDELVRKFYAIAYDVFVKDKIAFVFNGYHNGSYGGFIIDEDGNVIKQFMGGRYRFGCENCPNILMFMKVGDHWQMSLRNGDTVEVYSLPGDGSEPSFLQDVSTPTTKRVSRKIAREGQVLVETENNTYDLRGQDVK